MRAFAIALSRGRALGVASRRLGPNFPAFWLSHLRAFRDGVLVSNPCFDLALPAGEGRRDRVAGIAEARRLLAAVDARDRPIWGTAMFAGLRRGELLALRSEQVGLLRGVIRVEASWDPRERCLIDVKSQA